MWGRVLPCVVLTYPVLFLHGAHLLSCTLLQVVDPSYCAVDEHQLADAQAEHGNSAEQFMAAVRNLMQMSSSLLADVPNKVEFCRQRIAQVRAGVWELGVAGVLGIGCGVLGCIGDRGSMRMGHLVYSVAQVLLWSAA